MALVHCKECNKEISSKAFSCPGCGCPTEVGMDQHKLELKNNNLYENQIQELVTIRSILNFFKVLTVIGIVSSVLWILVTFITK